MVGLTSWIREKHHPEHFSVASHNFSQLFCLTRSPKKPRRKREGASEEREETSFAGVPRHGARRSSAVISFLASNTSYRIPSLHRGSPQMQEMDIDRWFKSIAE